MQPDILKAPIKLFPHCGQVALIVERTEWQADDSSPCAGFNIISEKQRSSPIKTKNIQHYNISLAQQ